MAPNVEWHPGVIPEPVWSSFIAAHPTKYSMTVGTNTATR